jgi:DNA-binding CsgD family transcriptional regulator
MSEERTAVPEDRPMQLFTGFLDALYPAALGEGTWSQALRALLALGAGDGARQRGLFDAGLRHVRHALAISRRLDNGARRTAVLECAAGCLPCGLVLLDARASVLFASERAHELLARRQGAQVEHGRLRSLRGLEDRSLARALSRLLAGTSAATALCVDLQAQGRVGPLRLLLMRAAAQAGAQGAVLALAFEQDAPARLPGRDLLREIYGLSAAEAELASLLLSGCSLAEAARSRSVSMNTAKSQLRSVLRKTASRNQAELMRTLIAGPAGLLHGLAARSSAAADPAPPSLPT